MKTRFDKIGYPLYCDAGPHEGAMRIDLAIRLYLSPQEYARYEGAESLHITVGEPGSEHLPACGTAESSGQLRAGGMAAGSGSQAAPVAPSEPPASPQSDSAASTGKEYRDGRR